MTALAPVVQTEYVKFHATHLEFAPNTPREVWAEIFLRLKGAGHSVQWWVGDAFAFGEDLLGEEAWQYLEVTEKTIANWASVCRRVPPSLRRQSLTFSHHAEISGLEPEDQEKMLELAEANEWSVRKLREEKKKDEESGAEIVQTVVCPTCHGEGVVPRT